MSSAVFWLLLFIGSQLFFIGCGLIPTESWRSADAGGTPVADGGARRKARLTTV
jgi:hypothetical protein